ncbi:hypothetical protein FRUB_07930 [Fimbriiglobus ruber]|uniref:Uncharacterized protein n=1 Tax=Fimbriiglobus ruber TaxID=1908690 RepID=A0A225DED6_9BACT|nr:hypothetical protein FRUB_07930 [Fimbriiglobus ruber]
MLGALLAPTWQPAYTTIALAVTTLVMVSVSLVFAVVSVTDRGWTELISPLAKFTTA